MIEYKNMNITEVKRGVIGHGVNCRGTQGAGIAFAIRRKWPKVYSEYTNYVSVAHATDDNKESMLGMCQVVDVVEDELYIVNCFTQVNTGTDGAVYADADADADAESLESLMAYAQHKNLPLFIPRIGCGLGGLDFDKDVLPTLTALSDEYPNLYITVVDWP